MNDLWSEIEEMEEGSPAQQGSTPTPSQAEVPTSTPEKTGFIDVLKSKRPDKPIEKYDTHDLNFMEHRGLSHLLRGTEGFLGELLDRYALLDYAKGFYKLVFEENQDSGSSEDPGNDVMGGIETESEEETSNPGNPAREAIVEKMVEEE